MHFCVFTFISSFVCAWKCLPRIVCLLYINIWMWSVPLSLSLHVYVSLFSQSVSCGPSFAQHPKTCLWLSDTRHRHFFPFCFPFSHFDFELHISPDMVRIACKTQRAALQTSLCFHSNIFTPSLFYQAAAAMHVIVTKGILNRKTK